MKQTNKELKEDKESQKAVLLISNGDEKEGKKKKSSLVIERRERVVGLSCNKIFPTILAHLSISTFLAAGQETGVRCHEKRVRQIRPEDVGGHIASGEAPSCSSCNSSPRIADSSIPRRRIAENNIADLEKQPGYYSDYSDVVVVEDDDHDYSNESSAWGHWDAHIQSLLPLHNTMASTCLTSHFSISARGWVMWEVIQLLKRVPQHIHTGNVLGCFRDYEQHY
ncbi:hypothetical protein K1719_040737 [Acacia pycnantha]|nr:hypothetical protein K1719_040737 [Acacia pycnantha]